MSFGNLSLFFIWWYKEETVTLKTVVLYLLKSVIHIFSIPYLLQTLFAPWKRDAMRGVNLSLQEQVSVLFENLISRFMGFIVRIGTIIFGLLTFIFTCLISVFIVVGWYILPFLTVGLFIYGIYLLI